MDIKKILVIRNDRLGETLLITPALRALKETFPQAKLKLVSSHYLKGLLEHIEYVDEVVAWDNLRHSFRQILGFSLAIRKEKFDLCVVFNPSKELHLISFLAGIPIRLGYNRKWGFLLNRKIQDKRFLGNRHEVEFNLELVRVIGADTKDRNLTIKLDSSDDFKQLKVRDYIVVHPYVSDSVKQWPIERFKVLAELIIKELGIAVVIVGGKEESGMGGLFDNSGSAVTNLTAKTSLLQLAVLLKRARLVISGDSGPMHLACCVNTPVLAIFRNDLVEKGPKRWGPWNNNNAVIQRPRLSEITVEEVFNKVKELNEKIPFH